jgi:hypothetical protein
VKSLRLIFFGVGVDQKGAEFLMLGKKDDDSVKDTINKNDLDEKGQ